MDKRAADAYVYGALICATTLLAIALDYNKHHARRKLEPDWTWEEVAVGSAICLAAARIRARLGPPDRHTAERATYLAFLVGALPIVIWQEWRKAQRRSKRETTLRHYIAEETDAIKRPPTEMAAFRRPGPSAN